MSDKDRLKTAALPISKDKDDSADIADVLKMTISDDAYNVDYNAYDSGKKSKRAAFTRDELVRGIIFSEIIGPPVSKRRSYK